MRKEFKKAGQGFTLIELLVVVAIIALLIAILIPALGRAKALAVQGACASSMSSVGKGIILYTSSYDGKYPASYQYVGTTFNSPCGNGGGDLSGPGSTSNAQGLGLCTVGSGKTNGYIHWSYFLYNTNLIVPTTQFVVGTTAGSGNTDPLSTGDHSGSNPTDHLTSPYTGSNPKAFVCGAFTDGGGLPPTDPFADQTAPGQQDSAGNGFPSTTYKFVDYQAPRVAFTLNEVVCPRNKFVFNYNSDGGQPGAERFVKDSEIGSPQTVILGTEFAKNFNVASGAASGSTVSVCKSHRPVHGFTLGNYTAGSPNGICPLTTFKPDGTTLWRAACVADLWDTPTSNETSKGSTAKYTSIDELTDVATIHTYFGDPDNSSYTTYDGTGTGNNTYSATRLDWVGRNHPGNKTNFLYCDGHVESKLKEQTVPQTAPAAGKGISGGTTGSEWGEHPYSVVGY